MKKLFITLLAAVTMSFGLNAQRVLTLEECINIALENNISIKQARNNAISAKAGYDQSKFNFLPNLTAGAGHSWSEGLFFDQTSGGLVNTTTLGGSGSINTNITIFNGFSNVLNMAQRKLQYQAAEQSIEGNVQFTEAQVVSFFLQVISAQEQLKIAEQTLDLLNQQLNRQEKIQEAGTGSMEQVYNFRSQVAQQRLLIVNQQNILASNKLSLIQLLLLDTTVDYEFSGITAADSELERNIEQYSSVYDRAVSYSPSLKSAQYSLEASKKSLKSAQYAWMPSLTASASIGTGWSSNRKARDENGDIILPIQVEGLSDQFESNVQKSARLNLNIPLFTRFQNRTGVQQSKIALLNSELNYEQQKNTLTNQVQQAYLALVNAQTSHAAAKESLVNLNTSFEFSKTRYENGTIDFVTYLQSLNNKNRGELTLVQAKYGILLRKLILDIYTGDELKLPGSN